MMEDATRVAVSPGFTWTSAGAWASFLALLGLVVRQWVPLKKVRIDEFERVNKSQADEIARLSDRVGTLEQKIDSIREHYEARLSFERASHEAELSLQRHSTRNAKQILYAMLDLIEVAPDQAAAHAAKMRQRMKEQDEIEHQEAATIRGAKIIASSGAGDKATGAKP